MIPLKTAVSLLALTMGLLVGWASAQHNVYLETPNTVPSYCQETDIWCGAASGQMILEGYPNGVEHPFSQTDVWNHIQAHKDDSGVNWATDPDGLSTTLGDFGPEGHWVVFSNTNAQSLTFSMTYWMTQRRFPSAALVYGFQHWVVIDGFTTDVDPTTSSTVNLQYIDIVDPWNPPCASATHGGIRQFMTGANWYSNYWYTPGNIAGSKWNGKYVAVVEPPLREGVAKAPTEVSEGRVIPAAEARERAVRFLKELPLKERRGYYTLQRNAALQPMLVNQERKGYYIVPFGYEEGEIAQGAVLINAYEGGFQEVGVFQKPVKFLSEARAVKLALSYLCSCDRPKSEVRSQLVFRPSQQTQSRFLPVWEVTVGKIAVYLTQEGIIFDRLTPLTPGD